jgi:hypothetical protein
VYLKYTENRETELEETIVEEKCVKQQNGSKIYSNVYEKYKKIALFMLYLYVRFSREGTLQIAKQIILPNMLIASKAMHVIACL